MPPTTVQRSQTDIRIESSLLRVLNDLAEHCDMALGDLLEGIVLHSFDSKAPFSPETLAAIDKMKEVHGCRLTAADSHKLVETANAESA